MINSNLVSPQWFLYWYDKYSLLIRILYLILVFFLSIINLTFHSVTRHHKIRIFLLRINLKNHVALPTDFVLHVHYLNFTPKRIRNLITAFVFFFHINSTIFLYISFFYFIFDILNCNLLIFIKRFVYSHIFHHFVSNNFLN